MKGSTLETIIESEETWNLLRGERGKATDLFKKSYQLFYRHTKFCPRENWVPAKLFWTMKRNYGRTKAHEPTWECCITVPSSETPPNKNSCVPLSPKYWPVTYSIWKDDSGFDSLVCTPIINYEI